MFRKRRLNPINHSRNSVRSDYKYSVSVCRSVSPVEDFYKHESLPLYDNESCYEYFNDVYLVLNQHRLDAMTLSDFQSVLNSNPTLSSLANIRSKMSDEELHSFVKSRYIQHPAELLSWANYLDSQFSAEFSRLQKESDASRARVDAVLDDASSMTAPAE